MRGREGELKEERVDLILLIDVIIAIGSVIGPLNVEFNREQKWDEERGAHLLIERDQGIAQEDLEENHLLEALRKVCIAKKPRIETVVKGYLKSKNSRSSSRSSKKSSQSSASSR